MLRDRDYAPSYDKGIDNIAEDFYLPCMRSASTYDRISGYFSSAIFSIAWPALKDFVNAGGKMRLICSPVFSAGDAGALRDGYAALTDDELAEALISELRVLLDGDKSRKPAQILSGLIVAGVVDVKLAIVSETASAGDRRLFHDKVGLFADKAGDVVGFRGSMNETFLGLAADGNLESIDVFPSWSGGRDTERVVAARERFEELWNNKVSAVHVRSIPEGALAEIRLAGREDWEVLVDEALAEASVRAHTPPNARPLRDHQVQALATWELHGRRGLLEHATGSGKTYTAIQAMRTVLDDGGSVIVLVPSALLLSQWSTEIATHLADIMPRILLVGDGNDEWRHDDLLRPWTTETTGARIVIATLSTAATDAFMTRIAKNSKMLVVADEAHRLGSPIAQRLLQLDAPWRLGLSATPERAGDPEGTEKLLGYFEGILPPPYTLTDAIRDRILTPYNYLPHPVELEPAEQARYDDLTRKVRREAGRRSRTATDAPDNDRLRMLAIARARILKQARGKLELAVRVIVEHYQPGQRWLVYCDSAQQLSDVRQAIGANGLDTLEYHSSMAGNRSATLAELEINGGILVSVRCLDEGIDLPAVSHALILASSRNPREFIQRRGRILRRYPGKTLAFLHDAVVVPAPDPDNLSAGGDQLLAGELHRVFEFAGGAANPQALTQIETLCIRYGVPIQPDSRSLSATGVEIDEEDVDD
ncbi:DEAD/DEAH box helicase family protein [Amycolatopsis sp. cmx-4-68]|uniref:DEAD/DEAH box helicase family protein n=1 Tax=Amycolatopsis sp. cmx-4-68 TaxID=2790938 RepID=UPI003977E67F